MFGVPARDTTQNLISPVSVEFEDFCFLLVFSDKICDFAGRQSEYFMSGVLQQLRVNLQFLFKEHGGGGNIHVFIANNLEHLDGYLRRDEICEL